jgi:hypothetical protein
MNNATDNRSPSTRIRDMLTGLITGDAAGVPFEGLSREHIKAVFKDSSVYPDPMPALKNREERWNKPGLYSYITRFAIMTSAAAVTKGDPAENLDRLMRHALENNLTTDEAFTGSSHVPAVYMTNLKENKNIPCTAPYVKAAAFALPLAMINTGTAALSAMTLRYIRKFTSDSNTAVSALITVRLLNSIIYHENISPPLPLSMVTAEELLTWSESAPDDIFGCGFNPGSLNQSILLFRNILNSIADADSMDRADKIICDTVNKLHTGSPVTRSVIDRPETLVPFAIYCAGGTIDTDDIDNTVTSLVKRGGSASATGALAAAILHACNGSPEKSAFLDKLVNKTRISALIESISAFRMKQDRITDFLNNETLLLRKENEERSSRMKGRGDDLKKPKKEKPDYENLNRHVVESWTKADKAKWKKSGLKSIKQ